MGSHSIARRIIQLGALVLIGDGVIGMIKPRRPSWLGSFGPELARAATEELAAHPRTARSIYLAETLLGLLLATKRARRGRS